MHYKFNNIEIDTEKFSLLTNGKEIVIEPQVFDIIVYLIKNNDKIVSRDDILDNIWKGRVVSDTSITNHIKSARKVLGDDGIKQAVIKTIHSRGYQFIADLESDLNGESSFSALKAKSSIKLFYIGIVILVSIGILAWIYRQQNSSIVDSNKQSFAPRSIAILPLTNSGKDVTVDFLGFALADQIIGKLLYNSELRVTPSTFVRKYSQSNLAPTVIGKELNVQYILSGNYLTQDSLIRFNFELVNIHTKELIWREAQELQYGDVFQIQDSIANILAQKLDLGLTSQEYYLNRNQHAMDAKAYDYYLRSIVYRHTDKGNKSAIKLLEKAFIIEPNSAQIYTQLAARYRLGFTDEKNTVVAKEYLLKALEINPKYFTALRNLSRIYYDTGDFLHAYRLVKRMLIINPKHRAGYYTLGKIYRKSGMINESIKMFKKALSLEDNTDTRNQIGASLFSNSQYKEAREYFDPESLNAASLAWQGSIALRLGENKNAFDFFNKISVLYPDNYWGRDAIIFMAIINGEKQQGLDLLQLQEKSFQGISEPTYFLASQYAAFGDKVNALRLYDKAVKDGYYNLSMMRSDLFFDFLREDKKHKEIFNDAKEKHLEFKQAITDDL